MAETVNAIDVGGFRVVQDGVTGKTVLILDFTNRPSLALVFDLANAADMARKVLDAVAAGRQRKRAN